MYIIAHNGAPDWGGAEKATALLLAGLRARGHRVLLLCNRERVAERAAACGVDAACLRLGGDIAIPHALRFAWLLRRHGPDVVLLSTFRKLWLGGLGACLGGVPKVVARVGLSTDTPRSWKYRAVLDRWIDLVVLNAESMRAPFLAQIPALDPRRVITIRTGVVAHERRSAPGALRRSLALPADAQVIGAVARLASQKRLDRLIRALAWLPGRVHCILAGEGAERRELQAVAERLGVHERVHLIGFRDDVGDVLDALDLFVICSAKEGLSNAMLEALAAGVPVVSLPVSGAAEALGPVADGTVPGEIVGADPEMIARAVVRLLASPEQLRRMGAAAARRARERFGFERMLDQWEAALGGGSAQQVLRERRNTRTVAMQNSSHETAGGKNSAPAPETRA